MAMGYRIGRVCAPLLVLSLLLVAGARAQDFYQSIFADGFESGDLSKWSRVRGAKRLAVTPEAALNGSAFGLAIGSSGGRGRRAIKPAWLQDNTPNGEVDIQAQFFIDLNTLQLTGKLEILRLYGEKNRHHVRLLLEQTGKNQFIVEPLARRKKGQYQVVGTGALRRSRASEVTVVVTTAPSVSQTAIVELYIDNKKQASDDVDVGGITARVRVGHFGGDKASIEGSFWFDSYSRFRTLAPRLR